MLLFVTLAIGAVTSNVFGQEVTTDAKPINPVFEGNRMLQEYVDLVQSGSIESAWMHWSPYARLRSERLGIEYDGISIKADLNSPLVKLSRFRPAIQLKSGGLLDSTYLRLRIEGKLKGEISVYHYYVRRFDNYPWLTFPQDYVTQGWEMRESRYFRFYISPSQEKYANGMTIESLDSFVDSLGILLSIPSERMELLAKEKIDYYFCTDEQEVQRITGVAVRGFYDLASDALITSALPHFHEVAHLMVNFRFQSMPLTTLPLLREGMATYLGGRATRAPSALLDMASYLYRLEVVDVESLLELMAFHTDVDASISYSASGLFVMSLVDVFGMDAVLGAYLELSGNLDETRQLSAADIRAIFERHCGTSWQDIIERFETKYVSGEFHGAGGDVYLRPGLGGLAASDSAGLVKVGSASDPSGNGAETARFKTIRNLTLIESDGRIFVRARPDRAGELSMTIFYGKLEENIFPASELFEEQFADGPEFQGYRFGLRFDEHEAGLYDYATSTLLSKFLTSFNPSSPYFNSADSTVSFSFPLSLTADVSPLNESKILSR